jgi:fucose 4-O-acetylase-like acetyltransferase
MFKSGRSNFIDVAKGIGISLVVLGHNTVLLPKGTKMISVIFSFHMPLFFFLSGVFFNPSTSLRTTITSKLDSLLKPYIVTMLVLGLEAVLTGHDTAARYALKATYAVGSTLNWDALWFLPHLLVLSIFAWITVRIVPERRILSFPAKYLVLPVFLAMGIVSMNYFAHHEIVHFDSKIAIHGLPWSIDLLGVSLCYFLVGHHASERVVNFEPSAFPTAAAALIFASCHYWGSAHLDLNLRMYDGAILITIETICGIYLVLAAAYYVSREKRLAKLFSVVGAASLFILIFHNYLQHHAADQFGKYFGEQSPLAGVGALIVATSIPVIMWILVKRIDFIALFYLPIRTNRLFRAARENNPERAASS